MIEVHATITLIDTRVIRNTFRVQDLPKDKRELFLANLGAQLCNAGVTIYDEDKQTAIHYSPNLVNHIDFTIEERLITEAGTARVIEGKLVGA